MTPGWKSHSKYGGAGGGGDGGGIPGGGGGGGGFGGGLGGGGVGGHGGLGDGGELGGPNGLGEGGGKMTRFVGGLGGGGNWCAADAALPSIQLCASAHSAHSAGEPPMVGARPSATRGFVSWLDGTATNTIEPPTSNVMLMCRWLNAASACAVGGCHVPDAPSIAPAMSDVKRIAPWYRLPSGVT